MNCRRYISLWEGTVAMRTRKLSREKEYLSRLSYLASAGEFFSY